MKEVLDAEPSLTFVHEAEEAMALIGNPVSPSISEAIWCESGVEYMLRRVESVIRPVVAADASPATQRGGHIISTYTLRGFNVAGEPEGKMVTFHAPDVYIDNSDKLAIGFDDAQEADQWIAEALSHAIHQGRSAQLANMSQERINSQFDSMVAHFAHEFSPTHIRQIMTDEAPHDRLTDVLARRVLAHKPTNDNFSRRARDRIAAKYGLGPDEVEQAVTLRVDALCNDNKPTEENNGSQA
ncbi:MAG TPA: hypothetical protein VHD60_03040 [Candidatus Saccharimonadales bacterium]|nr:hypothetical protein [Candidatus Saccharimonadales bacterium]